MSDPASSSASTPCAPVVYISYSRKDRVWRDKVVRSLSPFETNGTIRLWDDQSISPGQKWEVETKSALESADLALLLISDDFLSSNFITKQEVPYFVERGILLIPVLLKPCAWPQVPWLASLQLFPRDGRPMEQLSPPFESAALEELANEVVKGAQRSLPKTTPAAHSKLPTSKKGKKLGGIFGTKGEAVPPEILRDQKSLNTIKHYLIDPAGYQESKVVGICGPTGIGKTTLALVIANDDEVRRVFPDGIFYVGQDRKGPIMSQVQVILSEGLSDVAKASQDTLRQILLDRNVLLIFDDPDFENNFSDLQSLARDSRLLILTRNRRELERLGAKVYELSSRVVEVESEHRIYSSQRRVQTSSNVDWQYRLSSGHLTLNELFKNTPLGRAMAAADFAAFRMGAALVYTHHGHEEVGSLDVLAGYLLTAPSGNDKSEQALVQAALNILRSRGTSSFNPYSKPSENLWPIFHAVYSNEVTKSALPEEEFTSFKISSGLGKMLIRSVAVAAEAGRPQPFSTRHLLVCLLGQREWVVDPKGADAIRRLDLDIIALRLDFRDWIRQWREKDDPYVIDSVLGLSQGSSDMASRAELPSMSPKYSKTFSAFVPDSTAYGRRTSSEPLDDALGVRTHAGHLAQLIAAKDTWMPLSVGLFGAWGSGKSHFMDLLDERLRMLTTAPGQVFHKEIVQIRFNAWHYLDANLWANLVCEIFDQLFAKLNKNANAEKKKQVDNLKNALAAQSTLRAEADEALKTAERARQKAEVELRKAVTERQEEEATVESLLNDLSSLVANNSAVAAKLEEVSSGLALPNLKASFAELEVRACEVRSLGGRFRAIALSIFTGPRLWRRGVLLLLALALPLLLSGLMKSGVFQGFLDDAGRVIAQILAGLMAVSAWVSAHIERGVDLVSKLESTYEQVKAVRAKREAEDGITIAAQKALAVKQQAEDAARHALREAEAKMNAISAEIAELAPGRQLMRFLKDRASGEDYRQHLGLVSLVRRDFEQLSNLMTEASESREKGNGAKIKREEENTADLPQIDRIVLYIDDLDRCRADRVIEVLEAVHLLLAFPLFAVVVAVDPRWLRQSLLDHYPRLLGGAEDEGSGKGGRKHGRPATPQDYLEKIFQVPFHLQALEQEGYETLVKLLFLVDKASSKEIPSVSNALIRSSEDDLQTPVSLPGFQTDEIEKPQVAADDAFSPNNALKQVASTTPPSSDPQRLALTEHEVNDVQLFQPLFQTPRALKRLANTYCLIRVGVDEGEWDAYLGSAEVPGNYRLPMLLLAVTSAFPVLARPWLRLLLEQVRTQWLLSEQDIDALAKTHADTTDKEDWQRLASSLSVFTQSLDKRKIEDWPRPQADSLKIWVPRVARYSF